MDLIWWIVAIVGCVALAGCVAVALLWPRPRLQAPRPLANTGRLTGLPEYIRAVRLRAISACVTIALLVLIFAAAVLVAARPTGLPSSPRNAAAAQPEDIMVCIGGAPTDPAATASLRYFADRIEAFSTQRIGLTSANRRVVPLTRDYRYAAGRFADAVPLVSPVTYVDYTESVEDVLAMCLTGFPPFDQKAAQRRSLIYVGPDALRAPDDPTPSLFTADGVRGLALGAGVQVNVLTTGGDGLSELARETGGRSYSADADVTAGLDGIRSHPPALTTSDDAAAETRSPETPDVPLVLALVAIAAMVLWPLVVRR
ncbi:hypothetical protein M1247_01800 [Mycobacterium sp. 21AC1]|uniref:hypothetical protein n=1 Tax=[Mycobacterium] appelbergii TaxID=2939269 RepID=UPI00293939C2|nr:hypothetical protein [Mycobacterium sp. 21AC1]MDV3123637.1 hypothetical protein [Mycobacterium sp. 21AC1]